jgi:hypothetical protein
MRTLLATIVMLHSVAAAQFQNIRVSNPSSSDPEEATIAINPANPLNLAAGANIRYTYYSTDGGQTWTQGQLPVPTWGDPSVVFDGRGTLYYSHLTNVLYFIDRLTVHRSTDGGRTWKDSAVVGYRPPAQQDKEWLAADLSNSPYRNSVYMAWTEFDSYGSTSLTDSSRILFSRTTDGGTTWSSPVRVSDRAGDCVDDDNTVEGAVPAIGPNGEIYLSWGGPLGIMFDRSTDGGTTFGPDVFVAAQPGGWAFDVSGVSRCNGMPITACDISLSPNRGTVYVGWSDQRNGTNNTDIFCTKSTDGGQTWGSVKRVNDDAGAAQQFFTWMTVDPVSGYLYFVFYDRRGTTGNWTDVELARSTDGGETFQNFKVSSSSFLPQASVFFGDYTNIAARNGKVYPIWMRMDGTALSVWTAIISDSTLTEVREERAIPQQTLLMQNYPNPFNPRTVIIYQLSSFGSVTLRVYDLLGREVATLVDGMLGAGRYEVVFDGRELASGVYVYRLQAGGHVEQRAMILLR